MKKNKSFNSIINKLNTFWSKYGCTILQPFDSEVGAATFHSATFFNAVKLSEYKAAYTQFSKRPFDFRYNISSNKSSIFHQYQVIIKPSIENLQYVYLLSLKAIGINVNENDIRFIEDNWKSPTLGAFGIGWEVRLNGIEITQITYFQQMGCIDCIPVMVEIAYGLERLALYIQDITNIDDIIFDVTGENKVIKYFDIFNYYEKDYANYLKNSLDLTFLINEFNKIEETIIYLLNNNNVFIAYDYLVKLSNIFNLIDSKFCYGYIRQKYISKMKNLSKNIALEINK